MISLITNYKLLMTNQSQILNYKSRKKFNLEKRTTDYSVRSLIIIAKIERTIITVPIINQLIRSTTSIGANYREANGCDSTRDFKNKLGICKKEAKETMYWLELLGRVTLQKDNHLRDLWKEAHELTLIFASIIHKL